uniref:Splicing factor, arginine/serine-rich 2, interacting protein n=1 Tax=Callorhinchus milii TaxID=7868 RepID=V9K8M7_CALMI
MGAREVTKSANKDDDFEGGEDTRERESADNEAVVPTADNSDLCPICLCCLVEQELAVPESCSHIFCLRCILKWAEKLSSCPIDRKPFTAVYKQDNALNNTKISVKQRFSQNSEDWKDDNAEGHYSRPVRREASSNDSFCICLKGKCKRFCAGRREAMRSEFCGLLSPTLKTCDKKSRPSNKSKNKVSRKSCSQPCTRTDHSSFTPACGKPEMSSPIEHCTEFIDGYGTTPLIRQKRRGPESLRLPWQAVSIALTAGTWRSGFDLISVEYDEQTNVLPLMDPISGPMFPLNPLALGHSDFSGKQCAVGGAREGGEKKRTSGSSGSGNSGKSETTQGRRRSARISKTEKLDNSANSPQTSQSSSSTSVDKTSPENARTPPAKASARQKAKRKLENEQRKRPSAKKKTRLTRSSYKKSSSSSSEPPDSPSVSENESQPQSSVSDKEQLTNLDNSDVSHSSANHCSEQINVTEKDDGREENVEQQNDEMSNRTSCPLSEEDIVPSIDKVNNDDVSGNSNLETNLPITTNNSKSSVEPNSGNSAEQNDENEEDIGTEPDNLKELNSPSGDVACSDVINHDKITDDIQVEHSEMPSDEVSAKVEIKIPIEDDKSERNKVMEIVETKNYSEESKQAVDCEDDIYKQSPVASPRKCMEYDHLKSEMSVERTDPDQLKEEESVVIEDSLDEPELVSDCKDDNGRQSPSETLETLVEDNLLKSQLPSENLKSKTDSVEALSTPEQASNCQSDIAQQSSDESPGKCVEDKSLQSEITSVASDQMQIFSEVNEGIISKRETSDLPTDRIPSSGDEVFNVDNNEVVAMECDSPVNDEMAEINIEKQNSSKNNEELKPASCFSSNHEELQANSSAENIDKKQDEGLLASEAGPASELASEPCPASELCPVTEAGPATEAGPVSEPGLKEKEKNTPRRKSRFHSSSTTWSPQMQKKPEQERRRSRTRSPSRERSDHHSSSDRFERERNRSKGEESDRSNHDSPSSRRLSRSPNRDKEGQASETEKKEGDREKKSRWRSRSRTRSRTKSRSRSRSRSRKRDHFGDKEDKTSFSPGRRDRKMDDSWRNTRGKDRYRMSDRERPRGGYDRFGRGSRDREFQQSTRHLDDQLETNEYSDDRNPDWMTEQLHVMPDAGMRENEYRNDSKREESRYERDDPWTNRNFDLGWKRGRGRFRGGSFQEDQNENPWQNRRSNFSGEPNNSGAYPGPGPRRYNDRQQNRWRDDPNPTTDVPQDRSGWSSFSSWNARKSLPADVQNYYAKRGRQSSGPQSNWRGQEEEQFPTSAEQVDPSLGVPVFSDQSNQQMNGSQQAVNIMHQPMNVVPQPMNAPPQPMNVFPYPMNVHPPLMHFHHPYNIHPPPLNVHSGIPAVHPTGAGNLPNSPPPPPPPPPPCQSVNYAIQQHDMAQPQIIPHQTTVTEVDLKSSSVPAPAPTPTVGSSKAAQCPVPVDIVSSAFQSVQQVFASLSTSKPVPEKEIIKEEFEADKPKKEKKFHIQERAVEEVKLAIKPYYQKKDITKDEYKEIVRKAVDKVCHSKSGEVIPGKVANLVKAYVEKYKHARKGNPKQNPEDFSSSGNKSF